MNNADMLDLEQKIHQWCNMISRAAIKRGWGFTVSFDNVPSSSQWQGLALHNELAAKMLQVVLDDDNQTLVRTRMEVMEESCKYIEQIVQDSGFPDRVFEKHDQSQEVINLSGLADYLLEVYAVELFHRSQIQKAFGDHLSAEVKNVVKQKI